MSIRALLSAYAPTFRRPSLRNSELGRWIVANLPELDRELCGMARDDVRIKLNEVTGLSICPADPMIASMDKYLVRLKEMHGSNAP